MTDYFPLPAQWDVTHQIWRPYFVKNGTDWWATLYPPDNFKRPTGPLVRWLPLGELRHQDQDRNRMERRVRALPRTRQRTRCPPCRAKHHQSSAAGLRHANDACIQCHSQGRPLRNPIEGQYFTTGPSASTCGQNLEDFWRLEDHKLGETTFTHFAEGTAHKNRMQGNDFVQSVMYNRGVTCFSCHDAHGTENDALLLKPANVICLECHGPGSPNGPHTALRRAHSSQSGQHRQRMRVVSHAENRTDHCRRQRAQSHVPLHFARHDRSLQSAQSMHELPQR